MASVEEFLNSTRQYDLYSANHILGEISESAKQALSKTQDASLNALKESIMDIKDMIISRQKLNYDIINDITNTELEISNFIAKLPEQDERNRDNLFLFKSKSIEISEAKRGEMLSCWQDIAKLKEELRTHKKELYEKEKRLEMLESIIGSE